MLAAGIGGTLIVGAGAAQAGVDLSLRGNSDASFGTEATGDSLAGLSFELDGGSAASLMSDDGDVSGGLDGLFSDGDGHNEQGFGGGDDAESGSSPNGHVVPTPTAALLGAVGLAGVGVSRRRR
jgi:hypothetical protein